MTQFYSSKALFLAPENMKWKCLANIAKILLQQGQFQKANQIVIKMIQICPEKQKSYGYIEASKIYEYQQNYELSFQCLNSLKESMSQEWKIYMEYVSMLMRNKQYNQAKQVIQEALQYHSLAGRLWGELIQIEHLQSQNGNLDITFKIFQIAYNEIPKSGEVWCEGARLCMNPYGNKFDLQMAEKFLQFAIYFTPQYGDSFLELLKLAVWKNAKKQIKQELLQNINIYHQRILLGKLEKNISLKQFENNEQNMKQYQNLKKIFEINQDKNVQEQCNFEQIDTSQQQLNSQDTQKQQINQSLNQQL
ncbi:hypothetical protein PPERSA_01334 [Pseudocohnilembus persalinus]|uniref:Uncharacterized protein n=1 Tax=Pseudocohnilembus persalinus TaxID=266149 RepID=A0A0V0QGX3_PSEPJ|nr:hypothetical protein PPERSA_01334 [Pseudocohnilembus persalinus]|eukprot:KRX01431.1 hypothetical protein PPERSA_01334 [Pseudocohnilembus persalinus]